MEEDVAIRITLTAESIDHYCRNMTRHLCVDKRITAMDTLKTFLSVVAGPGEQAREEFILIRETLQQHIEKAQIDLQNEYALSLSVALRQRYLSGMSSIYRVVSRDGFWRLLTRVSVILGEEECCEIADWCQQWLAGAHERSQKVSPYPDSLDFKAAGLDVTEYMVMADAAKYFQGQ